MKYQHLIFDLDGTISDPSDGIANSVNYALSGYGYDTVSDAAVQRMIGPPLTEIFEHFLGELSDTRVHELVDAYRERYADTGYRENRLYADIPGTISQLRARGYDMGICTSKRADYATKIVEMFGLLPAFGYVDGGDVHIKKRQQLERLIAGGIDASSTVMIGDRAVDIEAGKSNGMDTVGVSWGFGDIPEIESANPTFIVHQCDELLELFP